MNSLAHRSASRSGASDAHVSPHPGAAIRSLWMMLWLDIKGSQGIFLLPVMVGLGLVASRNLFEEGVVLWKMMNFASVQAYTFIAPLTAGFAAWTASRDRRRHMDDLIGATSRNPFLRDVSILVATAGWGVLGYAIAAACFSFLGVTKATWGGFDFDLVITGALGIVLTAAIGVLIGRHLPGRFAPLLAIGLAYAVIFAEDIFRQFDLMIQIPELTPMDFAWRVGQDIYRQPPDDHVIEGIVWLIGLIGLAVAIMALARLRLFAGTIIGAGSIALALVGGSAMMEGEPLFGNDFEIVTYEPVCAVEAGVEVCVHPAFKPLLDETLQTASGMIGPVIGLEGARTAWIHGEGSSESQPDAPEVQFRWLRGYNPAVDIANDLFPAERSEMMLSRPASQLVILYWLADEAGIGHPTDWPGDAVFGIGVPANWAFGYPSEVSQVREDRETSYSYAPDQLELAYVQGEIEASLDRFSALNSQQQRAWLEENWHALRAGELTLEDLP